MLNTFCATSNLRNFLQSPRCPGYLTSFSPILDECYRGEHRGTLVNDINTANSVIHNNLVASLSATMSKLQPLETDIYEALVEASDTGKLDGCKTYREALFHPRYTIGGLQYSDYKTGRKDCTIYFQPQSGKPLVPGRIRQIFSLPKDSLISRDNRIVFIAVQRYKIAMNISDPFKAFEAFGAELWSKHLGEVEIIKPTDQVCHGIMRQWDNDLLVMRPLNRVSGHTKCCSCY